MLIEQTLDTLTGLQLHGMVSALHQWRAQPPTAPLAPADLVGLLADAEWIARENRNYIDCETYAGPDRRFKRLGPPAGMTGRRADDLPVNLKDSGGPNLSQDEINALMKPAKVSL